MLWTLLCVLVFGAITGLVYAINGNLEYDTTLLTSGVAPLEQFSSTCIAGAAGNTDITATSCSAMAKGTRMQVWKKRPSFPIFVIAAASILGWLLLMVMAGVGIVALPLDMIMSCAFQSENFQT